MNHTENTTINPAEAAGSLWTHSQISWPSVLPVLWWTSAVICMRRSYRGYISERVETPREHGNKHVIMLVSDSFRRFSSAARICSRGVRLKQVKRLRRRNRERGTAEKEKEMLSSGSVRGDVRSFHVRKHISVSWFVKGCEMNTTQMRTCWQFYWNYLLMKQQHQQQTHSLRWFAGPKEHQNRPDYLAWPANHISLVEAGFSTKLWHIYNYSFHSAQHIWDHTDSLLVIKPLLMT